ncbi:hypothetical protein CQW23_10441 [Capsicum baccatum]|uniref:Integrase catalytic domain-containing protein n=1 Tax=Capsicum baccatum TaxID=33114 RepID=A0A2G2WZM7_CAPBA|nr:hypothetical protein CQW23_10441 [Capsicum baccatum]
MLNSLFRSVWFFNRPNTKCPAGLLQPLPIPDRIWEDISLDFIIGLLKFGDYDTILVVVDHPSKYFHFIPLSHPYIVKTVAIVFCKEIVHPHGILRSILSDWDAIFLSSFWQELFRLSQTRLRMGYHLSTRTTPFKIVYGRDPPSVSPFVHGETRIAELEEQLLNRDANVENSQG